MRVDLHVPFPLRRYSNEQPIVALEFAGDNMAAALDRLFELYPDFRLRLLDAQNRIHPYLFLLRGTEECDRAAWGEVLLVDGDEIDIIPAVEGGAQDVRMRGFRARTSFSRAAELAVADIEVAEESVVVTAAAGRILSKEVVSAVNVPAFDRAAMDGYAIQAENSFGATPLDPISLNLVAESMPGRATSKTIGKGEACRIMTGAPMPRGANAVLMAEDAEEAGQVVRVQAVVTPGKNVGHVGEDISQGQNVLAAGRRLRPQDVGLLASIGASPITVRRRPRVSIIVTGNEILAPGSAPKAGHIIDSNSPMLAALIERDGGVLTHVQRLGDHPDELQAALLGGAEDIVISSGGSSVGREDYLPTLLAQAGELLVHGIAMRPSAPTGFGRIEGRRVFLLPGNPVSCLCAYDFFAGPCIRAFQGLPAQPPYRSRRMRLERKVSSELGRFDYVRVAAGSTPDAILPIAASGASLLSTTTRALGYILVSADSEGFSAAEEVEVFLYDDSERA